MRALLLAGLLFFSIAGPALAHNTGDGARGLHLSGLVLTFDPLTQSQVFSIDVANDDTGIAKGIFATATFLDKQFPDTRVRVGDNITSGATAHFDVRVPLRFAPSGCIFVRTTAIGQDKVSNWQCATTSGLFQAPLDLPEPPAAPEVPPTLP